MNEVRMIRHCWDQKAGDINTSELWEKLRKYQMPQPLVQSSQRKAVTSSLEEFKSRLDRTQGATGKEKLSLE